MLCTKSLQSCPTICDHMDYTLPSSSVHGILQARTLEWVTMPLPGDLPDPGIKPGSLMSHALQAGSLLPAPPGKPHILLFIYMHIFWVCIQRNENSNLKRICIPVFTAALLTMANIRKQCIYIYMCVYIYVYVVDEVKRNVRCSVMSTLCNPMDHSPPGSSVHGILQARTLEWREPFLSPGDFPNPGTKPGSPALQADSLQPEPPGKPTS